MAKRAAAASPALSRPAVFWTALALLGAALFALLMQRFSSMPAGIAAESNDVRLYREAGETLLSGALPYQDFFIEYPPASLLAFVLPALLSESSGGFAAVFAAEMSLFLVASLGLVALAARALHRSWLAPALVFAATALLLYPVATVRYDPLATLTLATAAWSVATSRPLVGYAALALGAAAKLVPVLAVPALAATARSGPEPMSLRALTRRAAPGVALFCAIVGLFFGAALAVGGNGFLGSFAYHSERGLQLESVWTSVLMALGWVRDISFEFGAFDVSGRGAELLSALSLPVTLVLLGLTALVMYQEHRAGRLTRADFPRFAAAFVLAFMIASKVLSPQYMLWLLPLVPLTASGLSGAGVAAIFLVACWTTTQIYPTHYGQLMDRDSGAVLLLLVRNLLLVLLWTLALALPATATKRFARSSSKSFTREAET
jgi:hypothetical protein